MEQPVSEEKILSENNQKMELTYQHGDSSHIDNLINNFDFEEKEQKIAVSRENLMDKESFKFLFFGAGNVLYSFKPLPTLKELSADNKPAVDAVEALYDTIKDVPQLHWVLNPANEQAQRLITIGVFFVPFTVNLRKDLIAEKKSKLNNVVSINQGKKDKIKETTAPDNGIVIDLSAFN